MTTPPEITSADELRRWTTERWQSLVDAVDALADDQWAGPTDTSGWTVKDHMAHVTRWDESLIALVRDGTPRQTTLRVPDHAWQAGGYDAMNEVIREQTLADTVAEVRARRDAVWVELFSLLTTYDDTTIERPGAEFGLDYGRNETFLQTLVDDLGVHYDQHRDYIATILAIDTLDDPATYAELVEHRWHDYLFLLDGLTLEQWTEPTDANGWTVKDHVSHVTAWDRAFLAQALGVSGQQQSLSIPDDIWMSGIDPINEYIRKTHASEPVAQVRRLAQATIEEDRATLGHIDLTKPARDVQLARPEDSRSLLAVFVDDQLEHYEVHRGYIRRIVNEHHS